MNLLPNTADKGYSPIKYLTRPKMPRDFRMDVFSLAVLGAFLCAGLAVHVAAQGPMEATALAAIAGGAMIAGIVLMVFPLWGVALALVAAAGVAFYRRFGAEFWPLFGLSAAGLLAAPCIQMCQQWEKAVVFRLGRFRRLAGPGLFLLAPVLDRAIRYIDTRIRATDFRAETMLTRDTVPVSVDAIAFWMIWDAQKAVLEVEDFLDAVILAAQSALRDAIGQHELASLLSERDKLGQEIQAILDAKTTPWGVTILSIGITDIEIAKELEDSLSKKAQAERERQSRLILAQAEKEIASQFVEAGRIYEGNPTALRLRGMNMVYEGIRRNGTVVLMPAGALKDMSLGDALMDMTAAGAGAEAVRGAVEVPAKTEEDSDDQAGKRRKDV